MYRLIGIMPPEGDVTETGVVTGLSPRASGGWPGVCVHLRRTEPDY